MAGRVKAARGVVPGTRTAKGQEQQGELPTDEELDKSLDGSIQRASQNLHTVPIEVFSFPFKWRFLFSVDSNER